MTRPTAIVAGVFLAACALQAGQPPISEADAMKLLADGHLVSLRGAAEELLRRDRNSVPAWFLMGQVYMKGEHNLPRARFCLERARAIAERGWNPLAPDGEIAKLHEMILGDLAKLAGLTDRYEDEIDLIKLHDDLYGSSSRAAERGWPLMKLGRLDEARALMLSLVDSPSSRFMALNTLGALEFEAGNYEQAHSWYTRLIDEEAASGETSTVILFNRAEAAIELLRFGPAERDLLAAAAHFDSVNSANPWELLAQIYAGCGRLPEAFSALKEMEQWSRNSNAELAQQTWREKQTVSAMVLLAAGQDADALELLVQAIDRPDRRGLTSGHVRDSEFELLRLYCEALQRTLQRFREEAAWLPWMDRPRNLWRRAVLRGRLWAARRRASALTGNQEQLEWIFRPHAPNSMFGDWLRPGARLVVGEGVAEAAVSRLLAHPTQFERPYLQAALGELQYGRGAWRKAIASLNAALTALPSEEALLRARVHALLGAALDAVGEPAGAQDHYSRALETDAGIFRALDLPLPVRIDADNEPGSARAAAMLCSSPRLLLKGEGFVIRLRRESGALTARFENSRGTVFSRVATAAGPDAQAAACALVREFHARLFAPQVDRSQLRSGSLDGSNDKEP